VRSRQHAILGAGLLLGALTAARETPAYCRTTTCDPHNPASPDACVDDSYGCAVNGKPLHWAPACLSFSVQQDGSPRRGITYDAMYRAVSAAYFNWTNVTCPDGGSPSLKAFMIGPVACDQVQYNTNPKTPNANIWMFRDKDWPHDKSALALTTVSFSTTSGEIFDADVELNSDSNPITMGDADVAYDLQSIVQHESGHTLGLAHTSFEYATMFTVYALGETKKRNLSEDDAQGICLVYPPGANRGACDPSPRHGFSSECMVPPKQGCALVGPIRVGLSGVGVLGLGLVCALGWRRRVGQRTAPAPRRKGR
jgi:hypothetical protein